MEEVRPNGIIALLTDFGLHDGYVAAMKGVVLSIAPHARLVDVSHDIAAHDIAEGAFLLQSVVPYYPPGTIFVAVVDPGVGTTRRALAIRTDRAFLIGPDNGLLAPIADAARQRASIQVVELTERHYWRPNISATFHGRDIFAPVAAHLVAGVPFESLGRMVEKIEPSVLNIPQIHRSGVVEGTIVHVDRFGNCVTNITGADLAAYRSAEGTRLVVELAGQHVPGLYSTYGAGPVGVPMALLGSSDHLEIAVPNAQASQWFGVTVGDRVRVLPTDAS